MGVFVHVMFMRGEGCSPIRQDSHAICKTLYADLPTRMSQII